MIPIGDQVFFTVDKEFEDELVLSNGFVLFKDTTFNPGQHKRLFGTVVASPVKLSGNVIIQEVDPGLPRPQSYVSSEMVSQMKAFGIKYDSSSWEPSHIKNSAIECELEKGDKIYFPYSATNATNKIKKSILTYEGKDVYSIPYHLIWCKIKDGAIIPVANHTLVTPLEDESYIYDAELNTKVQKTDTMVTGMCYDTKKQLEGIVAHISKPLKGYINDFTVGDHIVFLPERDWLNKIENQDFYIIKSQDIIAKYLA